ncbi:MAG: hypothetical protein A2020_14020 [Lentisphaerae bacterium GWF2_45_14]|nr:MAG: hypothetical protein A2020_14020 [Lentisphaerae bacterium GWF2_45_14]
MKSAKATQTFATGAVILKKVSSRTKSVEILFTGDFCPRYRAQLAILEGKSAEMLSEIKDVLDSCDLRVVNLEAPLTNANTPIKKSGPNLKADPGCVDFLKKGSFDIALLANNHIGDHGAKPVTETMEILKKNKIRFCGAGKNLAEARKALSIKKNDLRISILNYAENEFGGANANKPGASTLDPLENIKEIREVSYKSDITIVTIHGGNEQNPIPSPRMRKTYKAFADAGATAVVAMHTHCPQGIEIHNGVPIIYSLGNFQFDWDREIDPFNFWWTGYSVKLKFAAGSVLSLEIIPTTFAGDGVRLKRFDKKSAGEFFKYIDKLSKITADDKKSLAFWEAWAAQGGYRGSMTAWPEDPYSDDATFQRMVTLRNLFTCEAHCELMNTYLRLVEERRVEEASRLIPEIQKLQKADFEITRKIKQGG